MNINNGDFYYVRLRQQTSLGSVDLRQQNIFLKLLQTPLVKSWLPLCNLDSHT